MIVNGFQQTSPRWRPLTDINNLQIAGLYQEDAINVYFCGNYGSTFQDAAFGWNVDPRGAQDSLPPYIIGFVVINDTGFNEGFGYNYPFNRLTAEHEIAHHLLRRAGFPPYDDGEHVPGATGLQHLLSTGFMVGADGRRPILFAQDRVEINNRCLTGGWNLP